MLDDGDGERRRRGFLLVFDDNPLPMAMLAVDGTVTRTNHATKDLLGPDLVMEGQSLGMLVPEGQERKAMLEAIERAGAGELATVDMRATVDGRERDFEITVTPLVDEEGDVDGLFTSAREVTEQRLAQLAILRRSDQRTALADLGMEALAGASLDALTDRATKLIVRSLPADDSSVLVPVAGGNAITIRAYEGDQPDKWLGRTLPMQGSLGGQVFTTGQAFASGDFSRETRFPIPDWLRDSSTRSGVAVPIHTEDGRWGVLAAACCEPRHWSEDDRTFVQSVANVLGSAVERERAAQRLRREQDRFRSLADNAQDIVFRVEMEPEVRLTYVSPSVIDMLGRQPAELIGKPEVWLDAVDVELLALELPDGLAPFDRVADERLPLRHADGHVVWLEVRRSPVRGDTGRVVAIDGIARDVTASLRANAILQATLAQEQRVAAELRQVDEMRDNFLAAVSHELRTPLAGVLGFAMTLEKSRHLMDDAQVQILLERVSANARRLDVLLGDLLDLDRMRRSVVEPGRRAVDLPELVARVARTRSEDEGSLVLDTSPVLAWVDPPMVERILENLLSNARRHAGRDATVWIRVTAEEQDVVIVVEDDGPGIPAELRETVFQPFEQGPHDQPHAPGTGIGLSLVAHFAALHGGTATAAERRGGGASMRVRLPDALVTDASEHATGRAASGLPEGQHPA